MAKWDVGLQSQNLFFRPEQSLPTDERGQVIKDMAYWQEASQVLENKSFRNELYELQATYEKIIFNAILNGKEGRRAIREARLTLRGIKIVGGKMVSIANHYATELNKQNGVQ